VIPEGRACKLYLDVEWTRKGGINDWIDDASVMRTLVQRLCKFMSNVFFGVHCFPECILHLDSSTPDKFSRHLILNPTSEADDAQPRMNVLFANNVHAGAFMSDFVANEAIAAGLTIGQVIDQALAKVGKRGKKSVSTPGSDEIPNTGIQSTLKPFKGYKR
jgi:hypothetical protein